MKAHTLLKNLDLMQDLRKRRGTFKKKKSGEAQSLNVCVLFYSDEFPIPNMCSV